MEKFKFLAKNKIADLPKSPGVYAFKKDRKFLYIGKAVNLRNRVKSHWGETALDMAKRIAYKKTKSGDEALLLEAKLIKKYRPKYNVDWKDDKNYFYAGITKEEFPRIFITHQPFVASAPQGLRPLYKKDEGTERSEVQIEYIGPFVNGRELKQKLKELRKIHPYRTCKVLPKKPCLWYDLNQCPAPCVFSAQRLEAYDIADIQGEEATGSMVTFVNGKPDKNFYRKFRIKTVHGPNDVAMLKEVLSRRLKHREWPYPDLILIDGGKAQLNAAIKSWTSDVLKLDIGCPTFMALAKKNNELYVDWRKEPILLKETPREFFNLILQARDEAHRFARAYHHKLRDKSLIA